MLIFGCELLLLQTSRMAERYDSQDNHDVQILIEGLMVYMSDFMGQLMKIMAITQSDNNKWFDVYATMLQGIQKTVIGLVEEMVERKLKSAPAEIEKAMTVTVVTDTPVKITMSNNGAHVEVLKPENTSITGDSSDERSRNVTSMVETEATKIDKSHRLRMRQLMAPHQVALIWRLN